MKTFFVLMLQLANLGGCCAGDDYTHPFVWKNDHGSISIERDKKNCGVFGEKGFSSTVMVKASGVSDGFNVNWAYKLENRHALSTVHFAKIKSHSDNSCLIFWLIRAQDGFDPDELIGLVVVPSGAFSITTELPYNDEAVKDVKVQPVNLTWESNKGIATKFNTELGKAKKESARLAKAILEYKISPW